MKEKIHPDYHPITVKMTDGFTYETRSTWGKPGDVLQLDVDTKTHPAWVGGSQLRKTGQMEKFNNKFAFLEAKTGETAAAPTGKATEAPKTPSKADAAKAAAAKPGAKAAAAKKPDDKKEEKKA